MICKNCGKENKDDAKFCKFCGKDPRVTVTKKSTKKSRVPRILLSALLLLCSTILFFYTFDTLLVGICGESTKPSDVRFSFDKKQPNGGKNDYLWTLNYDFYANGKEYYGFTSWHGTRWSPEWGYGKYHVNYLPFLPQINRFQKYNSLANAKDADDIFLGGLTTLFTTSLGFVASYFLLALAVPEIPFLGFLSKKNKKRKSQKKANK